MWTRRVFMSLALLVGVAAAILVSAYSGRAPYYEPEASGEEKLGSRMRTWEEHDAIVIANDARRYIFEADHEDGALLFYGARHTSDRNDPQVAEIESLWTAFGPSVALMEGRRKNYLIGPLFRGFAGEAQLVHELARRDDVPMLSLEPSYETEIEYQLKEFDAEQLALFYTLRVYAAEAGGDADESLAEHLLGARTDVEGLRGSIESVDELDRIWSRDFPGEEDWRTITGEPAAGYLGAIGDGSRRVRGEHMARTLIDLVRKGERVFAVVGSGHVIRLEPILRDAFGMDPPEDLAAPGPYFRSRFGHEPGVGR